MRFSEAYKSPKGYKIHATTADGDVACGIGGYRYISESWTWLGKWEDIFSHKCKNCEKVAG